MSLQIRKLSPELQKVACEQLFEEPDKIAEMVQILKDWIAKSPHLNSRTDDQFLVNFLRCCKYSVERTKHKIDLYYTLRTHMPEWVQDRDPLKLRVKEILSLGGMLPLPNTATPDSARLILGAMGGYDPKDFPVDEMFKVFFLVMDVMLEEDDQMIICGQMNLIDMKNATMGHFLQFTPAMMKKMTMMMQDGSPFRMKGAHYVNTPSFFETVFNVFKGFFNEKIKSRLYVHGGDMSEWHKIIPKSMLPIEYGGDAGKIDEIVQHWTEKLIANRELLIEQAEKYGVDEKKRIGKPKNPETLFGVDGTFRQLQFD